MKGEVSLLTKKNFSVGVSDLCIIKGFNASYIYANICNGVLNFHIITNTDLI